MNTNDRFLGYCPYQIDEMLQHTWEKGEGVAYIIKQESEEVFLQAPIVRQYMRILELCKEGIKLTPSGYLPNKIVADVYPLGPKDWYIDGGYAKLTSHCHCDTLVQTWEILMNTGYVKKRKGILTLTKKGKEMLASPEKLFRDLLVGFSTDLDTCIFDLHDLEPINFTVQMFCAHLYPSYGEFKPVEDYARAYAQYNPIYASYLKDDMDGELLRFAVSPFCVRLIERFLVWFGLVEFKHVKYNPDHTIKNPDLVKTTDLFYKIIGINPPMTREEYLEELKRNSITMDAREAKEFFEIIGMDTSDFPEEELRHCDAVRQGEMIDNIFINPKKKGKYLS